MTLPWWTGIPAAQATLACGEATHRLIWEDGTLRAPDHSDPDGERALAALGGDPLACIVMLDAWRRHAEDPDVLLLGSRGTSDLIGPSEDTPHQPAGRRRPPTVRPGAGIAAAGANRARPATPRAGAGVAAAGVAYTGPATPRPAALIVPRVVHASSSGRPGPAPEWDPEQHFARLLSLGGGLGRRLDATVAAHWRERLLTPDPETDRLRARLHAALYGRVLATLVGWLGQGDLALALELTPESGSPSLHREAGGGLAASLPFGWLVEVWARGIDVIWGRFCLAATTADGYAWELLTVGPDLRQPTVLTVTLPG